MVTLFFGRRWWMQAGESIRRFAFRLIRIENRTRGCALIAKLPATCRPDKSQHGGNGDADQRHEDESSGEHRDYFVAV